MARFSKNRLFSRLIKQFNEDLTIKTESLETEAQVTTATLTTQVDSAVAQLVSTAPATLDTLDELAAALNDDANFATTVTNSLADKASIAYVDSAVGAIQGFSGSYDDLTGVPFQLDSTINSIFFDSSTPNGMLVGDLWYSSGNSKVYKAVSNPNNATVDNTQVSSPSDIIFPSPGGTSVFVTNGSAGDRNVIFNTPITIAAFYGIIDDMEIKSVTFEDDTVVSGTDLGQNVRSRFYGVVSWQIVGGIFNQGKKVKSILFRRNSDANGFNFNLVASGAPLWEEIDPGYSTLDSAAVTGLIDSAYVSARSSGGGGGTLTATAGSALTAGKPVQIKSNGLVEAIEVSTVAANYNIYGSNVYTRADWAPVMTSWDVDPFNNNRTLSFLQGQFYFIIDTTTSISLSSAIDPPIGSNARIKYDKNQENKLVVITTDGSNSYITQGTVSGNSITWGTPYLYASSAGAVNIVQLNNSSSQFVLQSGGTLTVVEADYAQDSFTAGTTVDFPIAGQSLSGSSYLSFDVDPADPTLIITAWATYENSTLYGKVSCGTISGNSISFSGSVPFTVLTQASPYSANDGIHVSFTGEESGKFVINMVEATNNAARTHFVIAKLTDLANSTYTKGTQSTLMGGGQYSSTVNAPYKNIFVNPSDPTKVIITREYAFNNTSYGARFAVITISGLTYSSTSFNATTANSDRILYTPLVAWKTDGSGEFYRTNVTQSNAGQYYNYILSAIKAKIETQESNIRPTDIIGIASATVDSGASVDISLAGSVDTNQSGLTPGLDYYVADDGSLTSTATITNYKIGVAVSSTDLLIQTISPAYVSYNDLSNKPSIPSIDGLATTTYVDTAVAGIVNSAPEALNTLNELAAALGDDSNFATTVTNQIASKIDSAGVTGLIDSAYVSQRTPVASATVYADSASLPGAPSAGDIAFITNSNGGTLQIYTGTEWHYISLTAPPPPPRLLWRLLPTQHTGGSGLFDLEPSGGTGTGWYNGSTTLTTGLTVANNASLTAGKWGVFNGDANPLTSNASSAYWNAGPSNGTFDPAVGGRTAIDMYTYRWIAFRFTTDTQDVTKILHRTFQAGRPDRIPNSMNLQYYNGDLSDTYDASNWTTYATLTHNMSIGNAKWDNITEGSTIASVSA